AGTRKKLITPINRLASAASDFVRRQEQADSVRGVLELPGLDTEDEIGYLYHSIRKMEADIYTYIDDLTSVTAEKERIGAELDVAKQIQASMLPSLFPAFPERPELDIYATMTPAKEVGGDFYDFFLIDDDHLAMVMADVSGKGVPAALFMVIAKTLIKNVAQVGLSPKSVLEKVNKQLCV
ncbi:MAG: SpoIIE family protein phosphatase, partial [Oscillospiraceae bacterium]